MSELSGEVLVGVDGSEDGLRAVRFAAHVVSRGQGELVLVHAVDDAVLAGSWGVVHDPQALQEAGERALEQAHAVALEQGLSSDRVRTQLVIGSPGGVLARLSREATLVVVGRRAVSGLERMFVGSTSVSTVAHAACPVVVISAAAHPGPVGERGLVGAGMNTNPGSHSVLEAAFRAADWLGLPLEVVHALQPPLGIFGSRVSPEDLDQRLRFLSGGLEAMCAPVAERHPGVQHQVVVTVDSPVNELVSRSATYDLLVLGVGDSGIPGFGLGGLLRGLMAHAECPLLITR